MSRLHKALLAGVATMACALPIERLMVAAVNPTFGVLQQAHARGGDDSGGNDSHDDGGGDDHGGHGADDGPDHDAGDDHSGDGADDGPDHDAGDDHGGHGADDGPDHDANDDHGGQGADDEAEQAMDDTSASSQSASTQKDGNRRSRRDWSLDDGGASEARPTIFSYFKN